MSAKATKRTQGDANHTRSGELQALPAPENSANLRHAVVVLREQRLDVPVTHNHSRVEIANERKQTQRQSC